MKQENRTILPVIVAGGGPAGLMAAAEAARAGCPVLLLEKMPAPGRKLLLTGSGRCNVTNACEPALLMDHFFSGGRFLRGAFSRFSNRDLIALLQEAGIRLIEEPEGKLFPESGKAGDILAFLQDRATAAGVRILTGTAVRSILTENGQASAVGTDNQTIPACAVVLAMGGRSWPGTGSGGDGSRIAAALGHHIVTERPGLVPLRVPDPELHDLQGLALRDVRVSLLMDDKPAASSRGDLLITHFGVSGPAVLRVSRAIPDPFPDGRVSLVLDLLPDQTPDAIDHLLLDLLAREPRKLLRNALAAALPDGLPAAFIPTFLRLAGLPDDLDGRSVTRVQRRQLIDGLKNCRFPVDGTRGWREAIITAGGVDLTEVDPRTMASRLVAGVYLAGEMLDIDADTGGFNLQAAWTTGFVAGRSAAAHCLKAHNLL